MSITTLFLLACAELPDEATRDDAALSPGDSEVVLRAEINGYDVELDHHLLVQLVEEAATTPPSWPVVVAQVPVSEAGGFTLELPTPDDGETEYVRLRVIVRDALPDGMAGFIREAWQPVLVWADADRDDGTPAGWSLEVRRGGQVFHTPVKDTWLDLQLRLQDELVIGGPFVVPDITTEPGSNVRVTLVSDDGPVEGAVGMVVAGVWGLRLEGNPEVSGEQPLRPVAFVDLDGDLALDGDTEPVIGAACALDHEAFVRWFEEPAEVRKADWLVLNHAAPGWNGWASGGRSGNRLYDPTRMRIDTDCE